VSCYLAVASQYKSFVLPSTAFSLGDEVDEVKEGLLNFISLPNENK